jgi:glycosyltransferase involved in cell wall biosynthesis
MSELVFLPFDSGVSDRRGSLWAALAHGKATVTTPPVVPIRYFQNGKNMLWPLEATPQTLAEAVYQVHSSSSLRQELELGARALASRFSWQQIAQDTDLVFRKVSCESIRSKTA